MVLDVRSRAFSTDLAGASAELEERGFPPRVVFVDADDEVLIRRFESVRRSAPAAGRRPAGRRHRGRARSCCAEAREQADVIIDTSHLNVNQLRRPGRGAVRRRGHPPAAGHGAVVRLQVRPAARRRLRAGRPLPAQPALGAGAARPHRPGRRRSAVRAGPARAPATFVETYARLINATAPGFEREGKRYLTVAVGCTGGKHRSVAIAEELAAAAARAAAVRQTPSTATWGASDGAAARPASHVRVVAFGGGHGLAASLRALRRCAPSCDLDITAVVTVGDDGGSSGRLRAERGALPPGRPAAGAGRAGRPGRAGDRTRPSCSSTGSPAAADDPLAGHAVGNLVLCGLMELLGDPVAALDHAGGDARRGGRVLPMSRAAGGIEAQVRGADPADPARSSPCAGSTRWRSAGGRVERCGCIPASPPACPEAVAAVAAADWLVFGPGSWYTSVIPHLLVPELAAAIVASPARRLVTLNLAAETETAGLSRRRPPGGAAPRTCPGCGWTWCSRTPSGVRDPGPVERAAEALGARLVLAPVAVAGRTPEHDPQRSRRPALVPAAGRRSLSAGRQQNRAEIRQVR